ncbi:MAG: nucleotidyltransferase domain-containing protein [Candidatus Pacebacteria bacterium]|nr:nucleotidyltransferase domain-containing protein [Candidatus Paceibacterota bacterium]
MKLEHYSEKKLKKEILEICGKYLDLKKYKIFFFGSRVKKDNFPRADIDIGIEGKQSIPYEIQLEVKKKIEEKIPTLYKFDVVDFSDVSEKFKKEAKKNIEYIK